MGLFIRQSEPRGAVLELPDLAAVQLSGYQLPVGFQLSLERRGVAVGVGQNLLVAHVYPVFQTAVYRRQLVVCVVADDGQGEPLFLVRLPPENGVPALIPAQELPFPHLSVSDLGVSAGADGKLGNALRGELEVCGFLRIAEIGDDVVVAQRNGEAKADLAVKGGGHDLAPIAFPELGVVRYDADHGRADLRCRLRTSASFGQHSLHGVSGNKGGK